MVAQSEDRESYDDDERQRPGDDACPAETVLPWWRWRCVLSFALEPVRFTHQQHSQLSPRQLSRPSFTATPAIASAATGSAHHQPSSAFASRPTSSATDR